MAQRATSPKSSDQPRSVPGKEWFASTHWSVVLAASRSDSDQQAHALEELCRTYWYPLYAYIRRRGNAPEEAQDLTQEFFARLLQKQWLEGIEKNGSRFRSFLLSALNGFLANQHDHATAIKRGGGQQRSHADQPGARFARLHFTGAGFWQTCRGGSPSDVYALGAVLYHLLTGRAPFQGETVHDILSQVKATV